MRLQGLGARPNHSALRRGGVRVRFAETGRFPLVGLAPTPLRRHPQCVRPALYSGGLGGSARCFSSSLATGLTCGRRRCSSNPWRSTPRCAAGAPWPRERLSGGQPTPGSRNAGWFHCCVFLCICLSDAEQSEWRLAWPLPLPHQESRGGGRRPPAPAGSQ